MALKDFLNVRIADLAVLYIKLHRFHWFVEGKLFYPLHAKFEELYDEATELYDEFAERLLAIGGAPAATMKEYLALTMISEEGNEVAPKDIFNTLIKDYSLLVDELKKGIAIAQDADDESTADLFIGTITTLEKHLWMFKMSIK
ncbi:MAG: DNA starvation/stationary phase protection protein [Clostridiales bacterium]|jgi:starvation-inducible DNA-binding protein|nr:DNA starvation/stationary phase protection protein [Clostridiales bacterium]